MLRMSIAALVSVWCLALARPALAQGPAAFPEEHENAPAAVGGHAAELPYPHPQLSPTPATWAGAMLIVIAGLFLAAATVGPLVRAEMPEEIPPAHSHDEPPGTSGHHGISGTLNPEEERHTHEHRHGHH